MVLAFGNLPYDVELCLWHELGHVFDLADTYVLAIEGFLLPVQVGTRLTLSVANLAR